MAQVLLASHCTIMMDRQRIMCLYHLTGHLILERSTKYRKKYELNALMVSLILYIETRSNRPCGEKPIQINRMLPSDSRENSKPTTRQTNKRLLLCPPNTLKHEPHSLKGQKQATAIRLSQAAI